MRFQTDRYQLDQSISSALRAQDLREALKEGIVTEDEIRAHVYTHSKDIWGSAAAEVASAKTADEDWRKAKANAEAELRSFVPQLSNRESFPLRLGIALTTNLRTIAFLGALATLGIAVWIVTKLGMTEVRQWFKVWWHPLLALAFVILSIYVLAAFRRYLTNVGKTLRGKLGKLLELQQAEQAKKIKTEYRLNELSERSYQLSSLAEMTLVEKSILPIIRMFVNERAGFLKKAPFALILPNISVPGLAEVFDPSVEIPTEAKARVLRLLESMPGGSIGISGPRGAGKTTLLWSISNGPVYQVKNKEVLSIFLSAPVQYDARDFILHLFSSVCRQVLIKNDEAENGIPWQTITRLKQREPSTYDRFSRFLPLSRVVFRWALQLGVFALILSGLLAFQTLERTNQEARNAVAAKATQAATSSSGTNSIGTAIPETKPLPSLAEVFELKAGSFLRWGLFLISLSLVAYYFPLALKKYEKPQPPPEKESAEGETGDSTKSDLIALSRTWRQEIKFQQSYSSGWSGSLKVPVGIEGSLNQAVSLAQMQMSLPEIVEAYREFVTLASTRYQVVVSIDELDKIESDEKAQQFLNDIKAVFGLERCFYLISVSESAMSSFERRGLPFRNVFDSAIDVMVYVDYLNQEKAKRLLLGRVIGLPTPFLTLCYAFSGGLARDLLRVCRELFDYAGRLGKRDIASLLAYLVESDVRAKIRATSASVTKSNLATASLIERLALIQPKAANSEEFIRACLELSKLGLPSKNPLEANLDPDRERSVQTQLLHHLAVFLLYSITLVEVFDLYSSPEDWEKTPRSGIFDGLAQIRRLLSSNPLQALSHIVEVRKNCDLSTFDLALEWGFA